MAVASYSPLVTLIYHHILMCFKRYVRYCFKDSESQILWFECAEFSWVMLSLQISGNPDTCIQMQQVNVIGGSNFMDDAKACFNALFMEIVLAVEVLHISTFVVFRLVFLVSCIVVERIVILDAWRVVFSSVVCVLIVSFWSVLWYVFFKIFLQSLMNMLHLVTCSTKVFLVFNFLSHFREK